METNLEVFLGNDVVKARPVSDLMKSNRSVALLSVPPPCSLTARGQWVVLLLTRTHRALVKPPSTETAGQKEKGCYFKPVPLSLPNNSVCGGGKNPAGSSKVRISPLVLEAF